MKLGSTLMAGAVLWAAAALFCSEGRAESSLFAPSVADRAAEAKAPEPETAEPGGPAEAADESARRTPVLHGEEEPRPPVVTVDERGNRIIILDGGREDPAAEDDDFWVEPVPPGGAGGGSPAITVDADGRKTLVLRGGEEGGSSAITVDADGRKTLVLRGGEEAAPPAVTADESGRKTITVTGETTGAGEGTSPWHTAPSAPAAIEEPAEERPYWLADRPAETRPYWLKPAEAAVVPYWKKRDETDDTPYWLPKRPAEKAPATTTAAKAPANFAPAIRDASAPAAPKTREISVYMFKDDQGVVHISNVPTDPRFRLFNITVVDIKLQRGLTGGGRTRFTQESLRPYILKAAATYNLDPALIAAVIRSESAFDAGAVSWAGAQGLMQLMPQTARAVGCRDPFDPQDNIMGGSRYLRWMLDRFNGNLDLAIAAYNCGPTRVAREWKIPNIPETRNYVVIVKRNYQRYQGEF